MPERAAPAIQRILSDAPQTQVRFVDAVAPESFYLSTDAGGQVLYVNEIHRGLVEQARISAE